MYYFISINHNIDFVFEIGLKALVAQPKQIKIVHNEEGYKVDF